MGGRVDKGIYNLLHTWPVSQPNIHGTYMDYFLETFPRARPTWAETIMLVYDPCCIRSLRREIDQLTRMIS
jgi:hypothetical protein